MPQETGNFKSRIFGGFDRRDVIGYIEELAAERNALQRENEELREKLDENREALPPSAEDHSNYNEYVADSLEQYKQQTREILSEAKESLLDLWEKYDSLCADLKVNVTQAQGDLDNMEVLLGSLLDSMESVGLGLKELSNSICDIDSDGDEGEETQNATDI